MSEYFLMFAMASLCFVSGYNLALCNLSKILDDTIEAVKHVRKQQKEIDEIIERNSL